MTQARYQIGYGASWPRTGGDWLGNASVTTGPDADSVLVGTCVDDVALYGVVNTLRDLGLSLLSVEVGDGRQL